MIGSYPISADGIPQPYPSSGPVGRADPGQPVIFFDSYAGTGTVISQEVPRRAAHLIVEAFPTTPGTATVQVVDAAGPGTLTNCTDSNGFRSNIAAYTKFMVKGLMERVAVKLTVASGAWTVWATFVDQASDRANYYDRNPLSVLLSYVGTSGPATVTRFSYTVPAGRKCFVESWLLSQYRSAAAGTPGAYSAYMNYQPRGSASAIVDVLQDTDNTAAAPIKSQNISRVTSFGLLQAGDVLAATTIDQSTGGTITYQLALKGTEFDN